MLFKCLVRIMPQLNGIGYYILSQFFDMLGIYTEIRNVAAIPHFVGSTCG